jgi:hypothetical protein
LAPTAPTAVMEAMSSTKPHRWRRSDVQHHHHTVPHY